MNQSKKGIKATASSLENFFHKFFRIYSNIIFLILLKIKYDEALSGNFNKCSL